MILEAVGYGAGVCAVIEFKPVRDAVRVEDIMEFASIDSQAVLIAYIDGDGFVLTQIIDVLIDEGEGRVGRPFRNDLGLRNAVFGRQVEEERRILGIRRPRSRAGELCSRKEGQFDGIFRRLHCFERLRSIRQDRTAARRDNTDS